MSYLKDNILLCCLSFLLFIARIDAGFHFSRHEQSINRRTTNQLNGVLEASILEWKKPISSLFCVVGLSAMIFDLLPCFLVADYCFSCMNRPLCSCVLWTKHCLTFLCGFSRSQCTFELSMFDWMRGARRVVKVFKVSEGLAFLQWINHI